MPARRFALTLAVAALAVTVPTLPNVAYAADATPEPTPGASAEPTPGATPTTEPSTAPTPEPSPTPRVTPVTPSKPSNALLASALITTADLGPSWTVTHDDSGSSSGDSSGDSSSGSSSSTASTCTFTTAQTGLQLLVDATWAEKQGRAEFFEEIDSFATSQQAVTDFAAGVTMFSRCKSLSMFGARWVVTRLSTSKVGDGRILVRISTSRNGLTGAFFVAVSRVGRFEVAATLTDTGKLSAADLRLDASATARLSALATAKVQRVLGR